MTKHPRTYQPNLTDLDILLYSLLSVLSAFLLSFLEEMLNVKAMCPFHLRSKLSAQIIHDILLTIFLITKICITFNPNIGICGGFFPLISLARGLLISSIFLKNNLWCHLFSVLFFHFLVDWFLLLYLLFPSTCFSFLDLYDFFR